MCEVLNAGIGAFGGREPLRAAVTFPKITTIPRMFEVRPTLQRKMAHLPSSSSRKLSTAAA